MSTPHAHRLIRPIALTMAWLLAVATIAVAPATTARGAEPTVAATLPPTSGEPVPGGEPGGEPRGTAADEDIADEILVRYAPGTSGAERRALAGAHGLTRVSPDPASQTEVLTVDGRSLATIRRELADEPNIVAIAPNHRRELAVDPRTEPGFDDLWAIHNDGQRLVGTTVQTGTAGIDIDALQAIRLGIGKASVVVAVIDDGVDFSHRDLKARAWTNPGEAGAKATNGQDDDGNGYIDDVHGWDFCNDDNTVHDDGQDGHGTHVAGTIAASLDGKGTLGIAPGISLMALKFIDDSDQCGSDDLAVAAIDYAASFGVRIINASWGGEQPSSVLDAAIADSDALFVAAAGNWGLDLDVKGGPRFYPASSTLPNIVSVGAVDQTGRLASFSNYGRTTVDLVAPGTNILSTYPAVGDCPGNCYAWSAGTSMAAPHVAGVAALVGSRSSGLLGDPVKLRQHLIGTARVLSGLTTRTAGGRMVNAYHAVDARGPVAAPPNRFRLRVGTRVGSTSTDALVFWPAATDELSPIASYGLRRKGSSGWTTVTTRTTKLEAVARVTYKAPYTFGLIARDIPGNVSGTTLSPVVTATLHADSSSLATYGSGWRTVSSSTALGDKAHVATRTGATVTFTFTGRSVAIIAPRSTTRGSFRVYVDGAYVSTVNLKRSSPQSRRVVFNQSWTTKAPHTVRIVTTSTRRVDIDGFVVFR